MPAPNITPIGQIGLRQSGHNIFEERHRKLSGRRWLRVAKEMRDNAATLAASLNIITAFIKQTPWTAEPYGDSEPSAKQATFLEEVMGDLDFGWAETSSNAVDDGLTFGFAPNEVVHKLRQGPGTDPSLSSPYDDGRLGIKDLAVRAPDSSDGWVFNDHDQAIAWKQRPYSAYGRCIQIPIDKLWLYRPHAPKRNPEGRALMRHAYLPYYRSIHLEDMEAVGIQRDFVGTPMAKVPRSYFGNEDPTKKAIMKDIGNTLRAMSTNSLTGIIYPHQYDPELQTESGFDFQLLTSGGRRSIDIGPALDRYDRQMAMVFLTQFLFLGQQGVGSHALASSMTSSFGVALGGILLGLQESFNRQVLEPLWEMNGVPYHERATWQHGDVEDEDLKAFTENILRLVTGGLITPDSTLEEFLRRKAELPEMEAITVDEEMILSEEDEV